MKGYMRFAFCKGDLIAIALVGMLAVAVTFGFATGESDAGNFSVQVYQNGALIRELPLQSNETIQVDGRYHNEISIQNGKAAFTNSNCPGADCVHSGWIDDGGRSVVCLPNRVEVRIVGSSEVDFVVG